MGIFSIRKIEQRLFRSIFRQGFLWPRGSAFDPSAKYLDFLVRQSPIRRHFVALIRNRLIQQAFVWLTRDHSRAGISTLFQETTVIEPQTSFRLPGLAAVATPATIGQDGPDLGFEKRVEIGSLLGRCGRAE
jgi:hypothetical protein